MSVITFAPPHDTAAAGHAQPIGDVFPHVVIAAAGGAEWAWTALHRCVAPPATGYLAAAGAPDPHAAFEQLFVTIARQFAAFAGDETDFRMWVFDLAHRHVTSGLSRRRHPARADLLVLSRLSEGPPIPAEVERTHVQAAVAAATTPLPASGHPRARSRSRRRRGAGTVGLTLSGVAALVVGPVGKVAAGAVLAAAATTGLLAIDPLPQQPAAPAAVVAAPADEAADEAADVAVKKKARREGKAAVAHEATQAARSQGHKEGRKARGLATAAAAPDNAGARKDDGLARAAAAPHGGQTAAQDARAPRPPSSHRAQGRGPAALPRDLRVELPRKAPKPSRDSLSPGGKSLTLGSPAP